MTDSYLAPARAPRQLDIKADTILRERETPGELSTGPRRKTPGELSTGDRPETPGELSTSLKQIERNRKKLGITVGRLCQAARIHTDTYDDARAGRSSPRPATVRKLARALDALSAGQPEGEQRSLCHAYLRSITVQLAVETGWDAELMLSQKFDAENTNDPVWLQASRLRRCAVYLLVEGLELGKANIGRAIGVSRQAIHKSVAVIEGERDRDAIFDRLMGRMMLQVRGERI